MRNNNINNSYSIVCNNYSLLLNILLIRSHEICPFGYQTFRFYLIYFVLVTILLLLESQ